MMKTATATAPSEVGDRGGQPEDERTDERTDQARRREADQVPVVAEAPASPPTGQHLVDHQDVIPTAYPIGRSASRTASSRCARVWS